MFSSPVRRLSAMVLSAACALGLLLPFSVPRAQTPAPGTVKNQTVQAQRAFASPQAAFEALVASVRNRDKAAFTAMMGPDWRTYIPLDGADFERLRPKFLEAYDRQSNVRPVGENQAVLEVGADRWNFPIPLTKSAEGWRFDLLAGRDEMRARAIGRNELAVIQAMLALVDAQQDYAESDPMKTGTTQYARRLLSSPGKKDGLYWERRAGEPESPLGDLLAHAQADGTNRNDGYYGYNYRMLYAQGPNAPGGARDYLIKGRMVAGFAFIAWPVRYRETGIMSYIVSADGVVYEKDLGPNSAGVAASIQLFDPDKSWEKSDTAP